MSFLCPEIGYIFSFQMCYDTAEMLNDIHANMVQIKELTRPISAQTASALFLLSSEEDYRKVVRELSKTFKGLKKIMDRSLELPCNIEKRVKQFVDLASELVECCVAGKSMSEREKAKARAVYKDSQDRIRRSEREKRGLVQDMERYER